MSQPAVVSFDCVHKTYAKQLGLPAHVALTDVSFHLQEGETMGMIGPNGAGKSTCLRLMLDFIRPNQGEIFIFGHSPARTSLRRRIGYLPEAASLPQNLSCLDMLRFAGRSCQMSSAAIALGAEKWLVRLGLWDDRHRLLRGYSKGMLQRASFAMALIHDPDVIILDEPMSGLDPVGRADIVALVQELKKSGKSILFCSHLLEDVERLVDRVTVLHHGCVLFHGTLAEFSPGEEGIEDRFVNLVKGKT
ncbi:MAG: ABC transporter ATP-binding protein [Mariprofundaceae bacterium]